MDRRMYRGNYYGSGNRNASSYRPNDCACRDTKGGSSQEDYCDKKMNDCERKMNDCERKMNDCERKMNDYESGFEKYPLGMCYVPWQCFENLYENEYQAFDCGTIFKDLNLGFLGRSCK